MLKEKKKRKKKRGIKELLTILLIFSRNALSSLSMEVMSSCTAEARSTSMESAFKAMLQTISS